MSPIRISEPKAVQAITHPLRMRLMGELAGRGTARVVDLATAVGEPANSVSFHLRQLAKHGLIEENPERVENGRERWWRMSSERGFEIDLDAMRQREGGEVAADILRQVGQGHVLALYRAIHEFPGRDAPRDQRRTINDDFAVRLSDTELQEMRRDLADLLDRWTDASRAIADADDGQERHAYYGIVMGALVQDIGATASAPRED